MSLPPSPPLQRDRQLSLKILLIVPFVTQVIAAVGITGWLSIQNGREATQELAPKIGQEVSNAIETHVRGYFGIPLKILQTHGVSAQVGILDLSKLAPEASVSLGNQEFDIQDFGNAARLIWQQMQQAQNLYFFYAANPKGDFVGVERRADGNLFFHLSVLDRFTPLSLETLANKISPSQKVIYELNREGRSNQKIATNDYDSRLRPWYQTAMQKRRVTWSPIYRFVALQVLGVTASLPIYGNDGQLRGVLAIDLPLTQIGEFLTSLKIAKTGQAFILERSGTIVAASTPMLNAQILNTPQRLEASQSHHPLLQNIFVTLQQRYPQWQNLAAHQQIQLQWQGETQYIQITRLQTDEGLDWLLIVVVPEQDLRDRIDINTRNTIVLCILALVCASVTGFYTSKWIAKPVEKLIEASHMLANLSASADLATGRPYRPIETANVRELSILAESFNQMAQQLQISFQALAQSKDELEIRVEQRTAELAEFLSLQKATFEAIADGVVAVNQAGKITSYNQRFVDMFALSPEILVQPDCLLRLEFLSTQMISHEQFMTRSQGIISHPDQESYDLLELADGRVIERYSCPQKLDAQIIGRVWSFQDITARIQAEQGLEEQKTYLRLIIDSIPQQIFWKDTNLVFRGCNKNWAASAQLESPESVIGKTDYDLIKDAHLADIFRHHDLQIMSSNQPELHVIQRKLNPDRSGHSIWLDASKLPIIDGEGKTIGILGVLDDITERKLAEEALQAEQEKSERLLLNILPKAIADRLKQVDGIIADSYESVTVLFADIVGFTNMSSEMAPQELVDLLNSIFSNFDTLCETYGLEKIKTIGDAYMVAGGIPVPTDNHAVAIALMALDMVQKVQELRELTGRKLQIRVGIHTGAVIAGVIGTQKFIYDLWGDTVNIASRMESHSEVGKIQVTAATYELLKQQFVLEERGAIEVKGKGQMRTYWLVAKGCSKNH
ncbi:PAS domain-containing protein [Pseudanabaena sp. FACHB-1277]|uniref:Adenylate cyclase n=1 Tax=Pseudanabaena cinerea FACHB-1277 TaxID=2949581 RepID=A0A926UU04_9CYAN|nr:adenylate/guanylate cyclase domain-containing protein [Pseudanabaena cinerea]MBD2151301.1 PAS domain-containing protein [Pseudanabaena cinerea FACHB-1277]